MKCDELKAEQWLDYSGEPMPCYPKAKVDAAIAELKQKLQDQCISCPVKMQEDDVVAELKQKLEDAKATAYAESVDAGMRERRLKRALWLARANSARNAAGEIHNSLAYMRLKRAPMNLSNTEAQEKIWKDVERKCRAKAEEYK